MCGQVSEELGKAGGTPMVRHQRGQVRRQALADGAKRPEKDALQKRERGAAQAGEGEKSSENLKQAAGGERKEGATEGKTRKKARKNGKKRRGRFAG